MSLGDRVDVEERDLLIFVDTVTGQVAGEDLVENGVGHELDDTTTDVRGTSPAKSWNLGRSSGRASARVRRPRAFPQAENVLGRRTSPGVIQGSPYCQA